MEKNKQFKFVLTLLIILAVVGSGVSLVFTRIIDYGKYDKFPADTTSSSPINLDNSYVFNPPAIDDAPDDIKDAVTLGYNIMMDTKKYAGEYINNELSCSNCHFDGGREMKTLSLVGVAAKYPKFRKRQDYSADLETRTQGCFQRSMNGKALPHGTKEMEALMAYYHWISRGIPIYADISWLGLNELKSQHTPDEANGKMVWEKICARCHGQDGHGTLIAPPIWGPGSYNDGAGMHKLKNLSAFTFHYMPKGNPLLSEDEALDVASYVIKQPRPHFVKENSNEPEQW